jgi:Type VII secretion system ESX-1, transport TM domain B
VAVLVSPPVGGGGPAHGAAHSRSVETDSAALLVSAVIAMLVVGLCFVLAFFNPAGQIGSSRVLADRASGGLYVEVGGVLHPALNLASARLITGTADNPASLSRVAPGPLSNIAVRVDCLLCNMDAIVQSVG